MNQNTFLQQAKAEKRSYLLYFFIYCPLGAVSPLIGQYLSSIGFSGTQVGIVTSTGTAVAVIAGLVWGKIYANTLQKRRLIALLFVCAATFAILTLRTTDFLLYVVLYGAMYAFQGPVHGLCDSFVMDSGKNFPVVRSFGALGYSAAVYLAGSYAEGHDLASIFYIYAITFVIAALVILRETEPPHYRKTDGSGKTSLGELLHNRRYLKLLTCSFFVFGCAVGNSTYFGYLFRDGGGSLAGIGLAFLLMAGSETVLMLLVPLLNRWLPTEKLTLLAVALCAVRFAFYAFGPDYRVLLATFFLQGMSNGVIWVEFIKYFGKITEPRLSALAISTFHAVGNNFSTILCSLIGGILLDVFGAQGCYCFFALWNGLACVLYVLFGLQKTEGGIQGCAI